jgi:hypothetical protein
MFFIGQIQTPLRLERAWIAMGHILVSSFDAITNLFIRNKLVRLTLANVYDLV